MSKNSFSNPSRRPSKSAHSRSSAVRATGEALAPARKHSGKGLTPFNILAGATALGSFFYATAHPAQAQSALPQGGTVVGGDVSIAQPSSDTLNVVQGSNSAIVNWQSFNVGSGNTVNFQQPGSSSVILNRVVGNDPSAIFGTITANGTVMLVNPNGVVFGKGSRVDVGGLVATTANIRDADFMSGNYNFDIASANPSASIVNAGDISIRDAGLAALVAPNVQNAGVIHARLGKVALGGAKTFSLDFHGDGLLSFGVGSDVDTAPVGTDANPVDALVSNSGSIIADGGVVSISARAVKDVIDNVINTSGVIQANSVSSANGRIILSGGDSGTVVASGSIKATGDDSGETGGSIVATGEKIAVASGASMDASGDAGGGLVAIGSEGDGAKGRGTGAWSNTVSIAKTASLKADAITSGDGGTITVLSETLTNFAGSISAKGGATGGNGGFAEVSSHKGVKLTGTVDLTALNGDTGTFLLDPDSLTIVAGTSGDGTQDTAAGDGTVAENDDNNGANTISAGVLEGIAGTTNIVLESTGLITVSTDLSLQTTSGHSFTLRSTGLGGITFSDASYKIVTQGGDIVLQATSPGASITNIGQLFSNGEGNPGPVSAGGNITVLAARDIQLKAGLYATGQTTSGNITLTSIAGSITASSLSGKSAKLSTGTGNIGASGNAISVSVDDLEINAGGSFFVNVSTPLKSLNLSLDHLLSTDTQTYQLTTSQGFQSFDLTDTADAYVLNTILTHTPSLNFTFSGEKSLTLGTINAGAGDVSLTANKGSIAGAEGGKVTASALTIAARDGITGVSGDNQALATDISTLNATTETGGIRIYNNDADDSGLSVVNFVAGGGAEFTSLVVSTDTITLGHVSVGAGEIGIGSFGNNVIDDGDDSTFIDAAKLALLAGAGDNGSIGTSGRAISTNARQLSLFAANNIYLDATATSGTVTFTNVQAANGEIGLTTHTSTKINDIGHDTYNGPSSGNSGNIAIVVDSAATPGTAAFLDIDALDAGAEGDVTLTLTNGYVNADDLKGDDLVVSATVLASASNNSTNSLKTTVNTVDVTTSGESANLVIAETDALTVRNVQTAAGTSSITIGNQSGDLTIAKIDSTAAVSLNAAGGAVVALDGNSVKGTTLKLAANGAIGSSEQALYTYVTALDIDNTGNIYIQNINSTLTSLVIKNAHDQNQSANVISLTSDHLAFAVSDDATSVSLNKLTSANLETVSFETDSNLVVGQIGTANASVSLTAGGNIADDGDANTRIVTSGELSLSAQKAIGTSDHSVEVIADDVTLNAGSDVYFRDISDLDKFSLTLGNADSEHANNYKIEAQGLEFALTHSLETGYHLDKVFDLSGLTFDFGTDADLSVGALDVSYSTSNSITLRSKGAIKDDGSSTTSVLANTITLSADKNIGESNDHLSLMAESLTAGAADGGIYIDVRNPTGSSNYVGALSVKSLNAAGDIVLTANHGDVILAGQVKTNDHNLTLTVEDGSLLGTNSGSINAGTAAATVIASGDIGRDSDGDYSNVFTVSAGQLDLQSGGLILTSGSRAATIAMQAGGDTASYTLSNGDLTVQGISVANGNGTLNLTAKSGSIIDDTQDQGVISADKVALVAQSGSITNISSTATDVALTAANGISFTSSNTLTNLSVEAKSTLADGATVGANGQSVAISSANSVLTVGNVTGGSALDFSFTAVNDVVLGQVALGSGKADIKTSGSIFDDGDHTNTKVTAGSVSLTAGSSGDIGADGNAIDLDTAKLSVSAGGDIRVFNTQNLTHLAVTSTNASTSSTKVFDFGAGSFVTLTDEGDHLQLGVENTGNPITDFSLTTAKDILVGDVYAEGTVTLETTSTGQYSNISQSGSDTKIEAGKVVLKTGASNKTYGAIGKANQALVLATSDLSITSKGSIYIDNSNTALTGLNLDLAHVDSNKATKQTYSFTNISGTTFTLADNGTEVALGMTSSGVMNFALSMDRQIAASTIDAGTSSTGSVSLTTTGQASGQNEHGSISATSITAGSVTLNSYESVSATTSTQNLSINSSYNVNVTNNTTLDSLKLDVDRANVDQTDSSRNITYSISSTGLTFSGVTDNYSGNKGLEIGNITQSGLDLEITAAKTVTVTKVDVGSGKFTLNAGESSIRAETGNAVITADQLTLNGGNVGRSSSGYFTVDVNKLSGSVKSSVVLSNSGDLEVSDLSITSDTGSINLEVTNGNLTSVGNNGVSARDVYLHVVDGNIGVTGDALKTKASNLTIDAGGDIILSNAADLFSLDVTANHHVDTDYDYDIQSKGLSLSINDTGSIMQLVNLTENTGLDVNFISDRNIAVGTLAAGDGRSLTITTTGDDNNISAYGSSALSGRSIKLVSTGSIGVAGAEATAHIQTTTKSLTLNTHANVYVDNKTHLASLSLTSDQATGGDAPVYILTSSDLTFDVTDNGTTNVNQVKDADAGLIFNLNTKRAQVIGTIDAGLSGSVTLTSPANITGANTDNHITAGTATFNTEGAAVLGSADILLNLSVADLSTNTASNIYLINDRLLSSLAIATHGDTDATIRIVGAEENHTLVSGQVSSANGTEYSAIDDNTGLTLTLSADGDMTIKDIDLDGIGEVNVSISSGGSLYGDNDSETTINAAIVDLSSSGGSVGTDGKTIHIKGGELSVYAGGGTDIGLLGRANFDSLRVGSGTAKVVNTTGDIALGESVSLNGRDFYLNNAGGSILSGKLSYAGNVTLIAAGSIGNVSAIQTIASGNGTTTLKEISATTNGRGATGSVNIAETYGLTVTSVSATSDVTLSAGTSESSTRTLTTGDIDAGTATVSLTSGHGAVEASSATLITAGKLVISATSDHIGSSGSAVKTTATALDLRAPGDIYVESTSDLASLSIDRSNDKTDSYHSSGTISISADKLKWEVARLKSYTTLTDVTDTTGLDFTYKSIEALKIGTINTGENGSVNLSASYRNPDNLEETDPRYYNGNITALNGNSLGITAGSVKLLAQGSAAAIGSSGTSLKMNTKTLEASSQSGGINVTNATALALNNITTGGDLSVTITSGDLTIDGLSYGSGKDLTLTASNGHIYTGVGATLSLNSGNISLSASDGIGANTSRLQLSGSGAGEFTANVTGTGSIYLNAQNGMSNKLVAHTANGAIDIVSNGNIALTDLSVGQDAVGNDIIVLAKSGNITIGDSNGANGVVAGANNGKINLTAQNGAIYAGNASSALGAFEVRLTGANGVGTADNAIAASGQRVLVSATNAQADVYLRSAVDGTFSSVSTNGGDISIKGSNGATILVDSAVSGAGSASTAGNITISAAGTGGDLILGNINAKGSSSDGQITLTSTNGSVLDDDIAETRIVGSSLDVNAATGVGTTERHLSTTVSQIIGNIAAGDVYIDDNNAAGVTLGTSQNALSLDDGSLLFSATNAVTLTNVVAKKDGETIDVTAGDGDISVNSVLAGATSFVTDTQPSTSTVKLKATNGSIVSARSDNSTVIMAATLSLDAKNNVGALTWQDGDSADNSVRKPLQVIVKNLEATTGTDGSVIAISNKGTAALSLDKIEGQAMTSVMIYSQGDITWGDAVTGRTLDKLMLSTSGTLTLADTVSATAIYLNGVKDIVSTNVDPRKLTLEATGASGIQIYSGSQGGTTTLNSTAKALNVQLLEGDTNSALVVSNTGALTKANLSAYNDVSLTNDVGVSGATITTNGENHTARITATTGDVTVGTINSGQTGTVALTATQGAIKFDGDQSVVTANVLTLTSFTGIGTEEQSFSTDVNTLNATVTGTGNIYTSYKANSSTGHLETHDGDIYVTGTSSLDVDLHHVWLEDGPNNESRKLVVTVIGGDVALSNALNGGNTVASLEVTAANISTDALTTGGSQSYTGTTTLNGDLTASAISINGNAILGANTMTLASTNGGDVKITGSVTGKDDQTGTALAVNAGAGDVGIGSATSHISQIALTGGNITVGNVTTSGTQTYTGTTTLGGGTYISGGDFKVAGATLLGTSTTVNTSSNNSNVTFDGAVDSDGQNYQGLEINSGYGTINFNGALGGTRLLNSIVLTSTSSQNDAPTDGQIVFASAANVNVYEDFRQNGGRRIALPSSIESEIGDIKIDGDAYLKAGASSIKALNDNEGGLVRFLGTITGNGSQLTVNAASAIEFNGAYADNAQGSTLALTAPNITVNAVTTKGAQSYTGATRILNNLTAGSIQIDGAASLAAQIVTFGLPETQTTTFDTSAANGNITLTGTLDGGSDIVVMKAGTGAVSIAGAATNVNNMTVSGSTISVHDVTTTNAQDYTGVTTLNGTYQVGSDFTVTGASWIDDDTTINTQDGTLSLKGTVNSVAHADLTLKLNLNGGNTTTHFDYALGNTNALGMLTINAGENGVTEFARTANISVIDGLVYTGGLKLLLPANITASNGPIKLGTLKLVEDTDPLDEIAVKPQSISGVIATLPSGNVTIRSGDDITIAGLIGKNTNLVMTSGTGDIRIGSKEGTSDQKIDVKSLNVATARTANLYGTIGGTTGFDASYEIGPLKFAPYYINDAFWRNRDLPPAATKTTPLPKPPSTPQVDALFNLNTTSTGITPNVVGAFAAPTVLNVGTAPTNLSVAPSPTVITTPVSGSTGAGVVVTPPSGSGGIAGGNGAASSGGTATGDGATGTTTEGGDQPGVIGGQSNDTDLIQSNDQ